MVVDRKKMTLLMARACMNSGDLQKATGLPRPTLNNAITGRHVTPRTIGLIAKALGVDVTEILVQDG